MRTIIPILLLLVLTGCSILSLRGERYPEEEVQAVFAKMADAYRVQDEKGFMAHVSEADFDGSYSSFADAIHRSFLNRQAVSLEYWIDAVVPDSDGGYYLTVRWEASFLSAKKAERQLRKGVSRLRFLRIGEAYRLVATGGDPIFTRR